MTLSVCTFTDDVQSIIHIKHKYVFWDDCMLKAQHFFRTCILPDLLGKLYTTAYCYCRCPEKGKMIACDNTNCNIEWFHMNCRTAPKGNPAVHYYQSFAKFRRMCE